MFTTIVSSIKMIKFQQNIRRCEIVVEFSLNIFDFCLSNIYSQISKQHKMKNIRFNISFRQLKKFYQIDAN